MDKVRLDKPIEGEITQDDIDSGDRCSPCYCPVALSLGRVSEHQHGVMVSPTELLFDGRCHVPPPEIRQFIPAYDRGDPDLKPFKYRITEYYTLFP